MESDENIFQRQQEHSKTHEFNLNLTENLCDHLPEEKGQFFKNLFEDEQKLIKKRKEAIGLPQDETFVGLALSGGGIRSATFCFGVLQVLERLGLMKQVDYLSTVSGGGYTGSAYSAWKLRKTLFQKAVLPVNCSKTKEPPERLDDLLTHLRKFSNFLSPRFGLGASETWRMIGTYARNISLHWVVLVSALVALFALTSMGIQYSVVLGTVLSLVGLGFVVNGIAREFKVKEALKEASKPPYRLAKKAHLEMIELLQSPHLGLFFGFSCFAIGVSLFLVLSSFKIAARESLAVWIPGGFFGLSVVVIVVMGFSAEWRWKPRRYRNLVPFLGGYLLIFPLLYVAWRKLSDYNHQIFPVIGVNTVEFF